MIKPLLASVLVVSGLLTEPASRNTELPDTEEEPSREQPAVKSSPPPRNLPVIDAVSFTGNTLVPTPVLEAALGLRLGHEISYEELRRAVIKISGAYQDHGYAFCGVFRVDQLRYVPNSRTLKIQVAELRLKAARLAGDPQRTAVGFSEQIGLRPGEFLKISDVKLVMEKAQKLGLISSHQAPRPIVDLESSTVEIVFPAP